MGGSQDDFILDYEFAHRIWKRIRSSARLKWPDDERLQYVINPSSITGEEKYYRDGTWDDSNDDNDWMRQRGVGGLSFRESPIVAFVQNNVKGVLIAGTSYTTLGSWYTFEMREAEDEAANMNPLRVPVPRSMRDEVKTWAKRNGGEVTREKGVEFKERYAEAFDGDEARLRAGDLWDIHVRFETVTTEEQAWQLFDQATDYAERGVRQVM